MKNVLTRILRFLKDRCFGILLLLFFPGWIVLLEVLVALGICPSPVEILGLLVVSLLVCAVAAVVRMYREGVQRLSVYVLFTLDLLFILYLFPMIVAVQLKSDNALTTENMIRVSIRLGAYKTEHGSYPPQQDMRSLLETLGIQKSDFRKTFFFDLYSATYHAPPEDSTDPEDRFITMRVKWHLFEGYDHLLFLRRDGTVGSEYLKNKNLQPERKAEPDQPTSNPKETK